MTTFSCIIFVKIWAMVSDCKFIPYFNILHNFVQNVRKPKWPFILSWIHQFNLCIELLKQYRCGQCQIDVLSTSISLTDTDTQQRYTERSLRPLAQAHTTDQLQQYSWRLKLALLKIFFLMTVQFYELKKLFFSKLKILTFNF